MLVWGLVIALYVLRKDFPGISSSLIGVVKALIRPKLLLLFGGALAYTSLVVYVGYRLNLWNESALKVTVYWFIGTAVVLAGKAVDNQATRGRFVLEILRRVVALTLLVEFVVNVYALPLVVELVAVLVVVVFSGMQVVARYPTLASDAVRLLIQGVLLSVGVLYATDFVVRVAADPGGFVTRNHLEELLVPPALTVSLIPYLLGVTWRSSFEQRRFRANYGI